MYIDTINNKLDLAIEGLCVNYPSKGLSIEPGYSPKKLKEELSNSKAASPSLYPESNKSQWHIPHYCASPKNHNTCNLYSILSQSSFFITLDNLYPICTVKLINQNPSFPSGNDSQLNYMNN